MDDAVEVRGEVWINRGGHGAEKYIAGSLDAAGGSLPGSDYCPLGGEVGVGDGGETLRRDASVYMYEESEISHTLSLPLPLSHIIVDRFSLVNTNKDNNI